MVRPIRPRDLLLLHDAIINMSVTHENAGNAVHQPLSLAGVLGEVTNDLHQDDKGGG